MSKPVPPVVSEYLAQIGRKGGERITDAKRIALKANAKRPRPGRRKTRISTD